MAWRKVEPAPGHRLPMCTPSSPLAGEGAISGGAARSGLRLTQLPRARCGLAVQPSVLTLRRSSRRLQSVEGSKLRGPIREWQWCGGSGEDVEGPVVGLSAAAPGL